MTKKLRLVVIAHDFPYPPNHGGRVDMWNRILALKRMDIPVFLIAWSKEEIKEEALKIISQYVDDYLIFSLNTSPLIVLDPINPSFVVARKIEVSLYKNLLDKVQVFQPTYVLLDGIAGGILAEKISEYFCIPLSYRSHNVEYEYAKALSKAENKMVYKIARWLNIYKTFLYENKIRSLSQLIFEVSICDKQHWETSTKVHLLNPIIDNSIVYSSTTNDEKDIDILFVGNLSTPNNIYGINWFLEYVVPHLENVHIVFAGANPSTELIYLCKQKKIDIIPNPITTGDIFNRARVLINPIWHGSGINIKMIEMLYTGRPIVSTTLGTRGIPSDLSNYVSICDEPHAFANAIIERIHESTSNEQIRLAENYYSYTNVNLLISELTSTLNK